MRNGFLVSMTVLLAAGSSSMAQNQTGAAPASDAEVLEQTSLPADTPNAWDSPDPELHSYFWIKPEYLHWWVSKVPYRVPLLTTNSAGNPGVIGQIGTSGVVYGNGGAYGNSLSERDGVRLSGGWMLEGFHALGLEGSVVVLANRADTTTFSSDINGSPVLSRPVIDTANSAETVLSVSLPGQFSGAIQFYEQSKYASAELNAVFRPFTGIYEYPEFLLGATYLDLDEQLSIDQNTLLLPNGLGTFNGAPIGVNDRIRINDFVETRNRFVGMNLGIRQQIERSCFFLSGLAMVSVGSTREESTQRGSTTHIPPSRSLSPAVMAPSGFLFTRSNTGNFIDNHFTAIPELRVDFGWQITSWMQATVGYNFLFWNNVFRPGNQLDRQVNPSQEVTSLGFGGGGPAYPSVVRGLSNMTVHGISVGIAFRY